MRKRKIAVITAALMAACGTGVLAQGIEPGTVLNERVVQPRYKILDSFKSDISISGSYANCVGRTSVSTGYKAKTTVELQKKGITWSTIKTWSATGGMSAIVDESYAVTTGVYRVKVTHQALNGSAVAEEEITYSGEVTK